MTSAFQPASAQEKYFTKTGKIRFNCTGGVEKIEALNKGVTCVLDSKTGALQFAVLLKGFEFEKALMQEHFNENYVESVKFPKAIFKGKVENTLAVRLPTVTAVIVGAAVSGTTPPPDCQVGPLIGRAVPPARQPWV